MITKPNLSKILKPFENKWVVLSPDYKRVLSSGDTLEDAAKIIKQSDREKVIFHRVIPAGFSPNVI